MMPICVQDKAKKKKKVSSYSYLGLPVLDLELNRDLETLPVPGSLGNVVTNLLRGQTQGTNLERQREQ